MTRPSQFVLSNRRAAGLQPLLDAFARDCDSASRLRSDPLELVRRYRHSVGDAEVAGLVAAAMAYGRAELFKPKIEAILSAMGLHPSRFAEAYGRDPDITAFEDIRYRFTEAADIAALIAAIGWMRTRYGSLGKRFTDLLATEGALKPALVRFGFELRDAPPTERLLRQRGRRGLLYLLSDASLGGACKRWNLYLRWMVRGPDEVDLGIWRGVPTSALIVPLDTHIARIARYLGLTNRRDLTWRTAEEITASLRAIDPIDPVRFDFALCHHGMSGACPLVRETSKCLECPLSTACRRRAARVSRQ